MNWKAGGAASSNGDGSATTSVSVNASAGFSIVSFTGTGSAQTLGHGLGVAPEMIIVKIEIPLIKTGEYIIQLWEHQIKI